MPRCEILDVVRTGIIVAFHGLDQVAKMDEDQDSGGVVLECK